MMCTHFIPCMKYTSTLARLTITQGKAIINEYYFNPGSELESFIQSLNQRNIELNHQQIEYTENYTTLAWKIIPRDCAVSQIQLHAPCQQTNPHFNISTNETKITVPSESFNDQITGELIDFNISSVSDQSSDGCPGLLDTVRFNGM